MPDLGHRTFDVLGDLLDSFFKIIGRSVAGEGKGGIGGDAVSPQLFNNCLTNELRARLPVPTAQLFNAKPQLFIEME